MKRYLPTWYRRFSAWKTWGSYIHWRLETFGLFAPKGKLNWKAVRILFKQFASYRQWTRSLDTERTKTYRVIR